MSENGSAKPKVGFYWCAGCGGCEEAVVDLAENILDVVAKIDIVFWPVAMDFKREDVEAMDDGEMFAVFINGAIRTTEQEEMCNLLRRKAQVVIAFGSCSHMGGVPGLANLDTRETIFREVYHDGPTTKNPEGVEPPTHLYEADRDVTLPGFYDSVRSLDQVVDVDYSIPGCAPTPQLLAAAVEALLSGEAPPKGAVLAPDHALCLDCPRIDSKPQDLALTEFKRPHEILIDEDICLLAQGLLCVGPATRSGCGAQCIQGNMPCTGCFGPTGRVRDFGAKILSGITSLIDSQDEKEISKILDSIPDPIGTFYRYSLPTSLLRRKRMETVAEPARKEV